MRFGIALILTYIVASSAIGARQDPTIQLPALDRTIAERPYGGAFLLDPPLADYTHVEVFSIGAAAGIPIGFEGVRGDPYPEPSRLQAVAKGRTRIRLAGRTVREAVDAILARDPRYHWVDMQGVLVVRPIEAWVDPDNPLNRNLGDINTDDMHFSGALAEIFTRLEGIRHTGLPRREPTFSLRLRSVSAVDLLNEIARSHGAVAWHALYDCAPRMGVDTLHIQLKIHDGYGVGSCSRYKPRLDNR